MRANRARIVLAGLVCLAAGFLASPYVGAQAASAPPTRLAVLWTSADPDVAHRMAFMYLHNSQKQRWFGENRLVVWGPSARLLAGDKDLQAKVREMIRDGVVVQACVACADSYGVSARLREMGIEVKGMGKPLTEMLQAGWKVLSL
ncbi:MAG TPA: DsrE family protein [Phycisphaerae bacterium]|nr:DsrE family protein [Phycisphaerae bacterium]